MALQHDITNYDKGFRVRLVDTVIVSDENNMKVASNLKDTVSVVDIFYVTTRGIQYPVDSVRVTDNFRYKINKIKRFIDKVSSDDNFVIPVNKYLYFSDSVSTTDNPLFQFRAGFVLKFTDVANVTDNSTNKYIRTLKFVDTVRITDADLECQDESL